MSDMAQLKPGKPLSIGERLLQLMYGDQGVSDFNIRQMKERELARMAAKDYSGGITEQIPGGNPEAATPIDALFGAILGMGGGGLPAGVKRAARVGETPKVPAPWASANSLTAQSPEWMANVGESAGSRPKRGEVRVYHGTAQAGFDRFSRGKTQDALYGPGIYTTMDPEIASSYTKKAQSRTIFPGEVVKPNAEAVIPMHLRPGNVLNMEKKPPAKLVQKLSEVEYADFQVDAKGKPVFRDGNDLYNALVYTFGTRADANDWLVSNGVNTLTHMGGSISRGKKHRVFISLEGKGLRGAMSDKPVGYEDVIE